MKKLLAIVVFLLCAGPVAAADRYLVVASCDGTWTDTDCWSASSGGAGGETAPGSSDAVIFDTNSGNTSMSLNSSNRAAASLTISNYTGTLAFGSNTLTVSGNVTLGTGMTFTGTGALIINAASTMTSNGITVPGGLTLASAVTYTLADNWAVTGTCTLGVTGSTTTINDNTLTCNSSLALGVSTGNVLGTTTIVMGGTGSITASILTTGTLRNNFTINSSGTVTCATTIRYQTGTLTYTAGTVSAASCTLVLPAAATITVNASGLTIGTVSITAGNQTFNGTNGFTMGTLSQLVAGGSHTFKESLTYTITSSLRITATSASPTTIASASAMTAFNLNVVGATVALAYVTATDITSSTPVYVYTGSLTRTTNWTSGSVIGSGSGGGGIIGG